MIKALPQLLMPSLPSKILKLLEGNIKNLKTESETKMPRNLFSDAFVYFFCVTS